MLVTFEGLDKVGKTTLVNNIYQLISQKNQYKIYKTYEPGGTIYADKLGQLLKYEKSNPLAKLYGFISARCDHMDIIRNKLENGYIVLCDRYIDSTLAYQGAELGYEYVQQILAQVPLIAPNLTFLIEGNPFICRCTDEFESMHEEYFYKVQNIFNIIKNKPHVIPINNKNIVIEDIVKKIIGGTGIEPATSSV